ncbi:MAG: glycosyltransferase family 2 protein [Chlorobia bacterium]|nr:glycosyltransferase family 2 protein [Fimbriimonadaceae bacterium]
MTLTVAICTGGRDSLIHAIRSLANQSRPPDQLLIVDQSGQSKARRAVAEAGYPHSFIVVDQDAKGLSKARNEVVKQLTTDWVFFTDDDCVVSLDLVDQFHKVIGQYPEASFLAGTCIRPLDYDPVTQDVPGVYIGHQVEINARTAMLEAEFMGACLAFRKDLLNSVGLFDPYLGAGTEWPAGEECDYVFRAISKGFVGRATARMVVFHEYGARTRPADDTENGRIGNAVVMWKARQIGDPKLIAMADRICPYGPKKVLLSRLTLGHQYPVHLKMYRKCKAVFARLDREFSVKEDVLVKTSG